jgi:hypothetical protein
MMNNFGNTDSSNGSNTSENTNPSAAVQNYRNQLSLLIDTPEKLDLFLQVAPEVINRINTGGPLIQPSPPPSTNQVNIFTTPLSSRRQSIAHGMNQPFFSSSLQNLLGSPNHSIMQDLFGSASPSKTTISYNLFQRQLLIK